MALTRPIDCVIVLPSLTAGGAEYWLLDLMAAIDEPVRWEAVLLADGPLRGMLNELGIPVTVFPTGRGALDIARTVMSLTRWLHRRMPDVVLANGVKAAAVAVPAGLAASVRTVWVRHDFSWDKVLGRILARLADQVTATSQDLLDAVAVHGPVILPPLPQPARPRDEAVRFWTERGCDLHPPTLAVTCRLIAYKGVDDAVRAVASEGGQQWRLVVVGSDDPTAPGERAKLEALAATLGVTDRVFFAGAVPHASQWLAAFEAVAVLTKAHPVSRYTAEGFSMVVLESVLAGVPVIASDTTPAAKLVPEAALLVRPNSPAQVAKALLHIRDLAPQAMVAAARLKVHHPTVKQSAAELFRLISETAMRPGAGRREGPPMTVVITVLNERAAIDGLISALMPQLGVDDEVVVVDGGSTDGTVASLERWAGVDPRFRHSVVPEAGISTGRNAAIESARHDIVATTDAGCVPDPGWLDALRAAMGGHCGPALATGVYTVTTRSSFERASALACYPDASEATHPSPVVRIFAPLGRVFAADEPTGRSMAFARAAWAGAGGFNENLPTSEDVAFGAAVVASGGRAVLTTDATVAWEQRPNILSTARMYRRYGRDDGRSRRLKPIVRDLSRAGAYALAAIAVAKGRVGVRSLVAAGSVAYLAQPIARGVRQRAKPAEMLLVPLALAVKDVNKAVGCVEGLIAPRASRPRRT